MDLSQFYNQFRDETGDNLRTIQAGVLRIEGAATRDDPATRDDLDRVFRAAHTIKGGARMLGIEGVAELAHALEDVLGAIRSGTRPLDSATANLLLTSCDTLQRLADEPQAVPPPDDATIAPLVAQLRAAAATSAAAPVPSNAPPSNAPPAPAPAPAPAASADTPAPNNDAPARSGLRQVVRVRTARLDRLLNLTGELVVGMQPFEHHQATLTKLNEHLTAQLRLLTTIQQQHEHDLTPDLQQHVTTLHDHATSLQRHVRQLSDEMERSVTSQQLLLDDLEQEVIGARLTPIGSLLQTLPRAVRDLAQQTGKQVTLHLAGEETEIDRRLLEGLRDPLLHLVRNAVDHGIEPPDARTAQGKPATGNVTVQATATGGMVRITVEDDGCGLDPEKLRRSAIERGMLDSERAARLTRRELLDLIFVPGMTTARNVSPVSGRGVGMDIVRSNVSELGGQVTLESTMGQGTRLVLLLPLTLVTTRVLLVQVGTQPFALPASGCRGAIHIYPDAVHTIEGRAVATVQEQTVPLVELATLLGLAAPGTPTERERTPAVLVAAGQGTLALLVDRVLDEREAVIRPLGALFAQHPRYSGVVQLGGHQLALLLDPLLLAREAHGVTLSPRPTVPAAAPRSRILVADDSFTTRELMGSILRTAGYAVTLATDGHDALERLHAAAHDLVVSDVEMPRLDGFGLTSAVRQHSELRHIPVIIVSSLASDEQQRRGLTAGAQAYIVKSQFNQDTLLTTIHRLLQSGIQGG